MNWTTTSIYQQNLKAYLQHKRHIWNEGGAFSSKTYSILQVLILIAQYAKKPLLISGVSESMPHLKRGAVRDFQNLMGDMFIPDRFNRTDFIYDFGLAKIEFFSADQSDKLRGARRDILFVNEANNITYDAFRELDARTRICTFADWNPVSEFWYHQNHLGDSPDSVFIHSTYRDAAHVISPEIIRNLLEMGSHDPNWANVYLEGRPGKIEGLVYPEFSLIDELPKGDYFYGMDFGFSNDPSTLVKCVIIDNKLYMQELIYQIGMTNQELAQRMTELGVRKNYDEIFADSSEPKSIEEIHRYGFNIKGVTKGADSVEYGLQRVRQFKLFWTKDSLNGIKEIKNYRYIPDKDGKLTDKTTHLFSHLADALRYAVIGKLDIKPRPFLIG